MLNLSYRMGSRPVYWILDKSVLYLGESEGQAKYKLPINEKFIISYLPPMFISGLFIKPSSITGYWMSLCCI